MAIAVGSGLGSIDDFEVYSSGYTILDSNSPSWNSELLREKYLGE